MTILGNHIGGERAASASGRHGPVNNPATGKETKQVSFASNEEVDRAVAAAQDAFPKWANTPPMRCARVMFRYLELLEKHKRYLGTSDASTSSGARWIWWLNSSGMWTRAVALPARRECSLSARRHRRISRGTCRAGAPERRDGSSRSDCLRPRRSGRVLDCAGSPCDRVGTRRRGRRPCSRSAVDRGAIPDPQTWCRDADRGGGTSSVTGRGADPSAGRGRLLGDRAQGRQTALRDRPPDRSFRLLYPHPRATRLPLAPDPGGDPRWFPAARPIPRADRPHRRPSGLVAAGAGIRLQRVTSRFAVSSQPFP